MADDSPIVEGDKGIAAIVGRSTEWARRERATYPDPLPAKRFRGGRVWAHRSRVALWLQRRDPDASSGLVVVHGVVRIARVVCRCVAHCQALLPWAAKPVRDPIPAWKSEDGKVHAYRDALVDWLDRQSAPSASPRFRRKM